MVLIEYAAQQQTAIEINASPWRLDLVGLGVIKQSGRVFLQV